MAAGKTGSSGKRTAATATMPSDREIVFTRVFDAPRDLVFKAWTDPKHLVHWWGPHGFTNPVCELDVRPGGAILIHMRAPDGVDYPVKGVFREIVEPKRLVFTTFLEHGEGNTILETLTTVTFAEQGGKTKLIVRAAVVKSTAEAAPYLAGMQEGWTQSIDRLAAYVAKI